MLRDPRISAITGTVRRHPPQPSAPRTLAPRSDPPCLSHSRSVHYLCKSRNPGLNARHLPRAEPPPTPCAPPATRAPLPTVRAGPFVAPFPGSAAGLATSPGKAQSPGPVPRVSRRQRVPRPRQIAERQPRTPIRRWPPFASPRHAPNPAKTHPAPPQEVFWKKLLPRARRPLNTPPTPPATPHSLQAPLPVTCPMPRGPASPSPFAPMGRPALSLAPPSARSFPASEARNLAQKIRPNRLSPARPLWGRAGERRFPPSPPRLCGPRPPRRPCTLSVRSTVTPESRS